MEGQDETKAGSSRRAMVGWTIAIVIVLVASAGFVFARQARLARQTDALATIAAEGPRVLVVAVTSGGAAGAIEFPASIHGYIETPVYAKVAGYMKRILVDKGDRVRNGEVLAIIESPETDKAVADALANYRLQLVTDRRDLYLLHHEVIAQQDEDTQHALMLQARATYQQQLALQQYEVVRAPFDGMVTARYVDPGTLIPQSTTPASGNPIVALATLSPLRIYANVPQAVALNVNDGEAAAITVTELPGRTFSGTITRHPEALDPSTRTMLVEVDLLNRDRALLPGMYASLSITTHGAAGRIMVPDDALVYRNDKIYLPLVRNNRLHLAEVKLGRDNGYRVEVTGDVAVGDLVAMNVGQSAREGELVQPVVGHGS